MQDTKTRRIEVRERLIRRIERLSVERIAVAVWICTVLFIGYTLYLASGLLIPLTFALLLYLTIRPLVSKLRRWGLSPWLAAGAIMLSFAAAVGLVAFLILQPAQYWLSAGPENFKEVGGKLKSITRPLDVVDDVEAQLEQLTEQQRVEAEDAPVEVQVTSPTFMDRQTVLSHTWQAALFFGGIGLIAFFLLATGDELLKRLLRAMPSFGDRKKALSIIIDVQEAVGHYLVQITLINFCLGCAVGLMAYLMKMPTPLLWAVLAMTFNFIPYLGAVAGLAIIFVAAAMKFELSYAALIAGLYFSFTTIEGNFITPMVLGRSLEVEPVVVLIAISVWGFLWGLPGVVMAVPLLVAMRLVCVRFEATRGIAILLGEQVVDEVD